VVVTGLGIVSPVGNRVDTAWQAICNGESGIGPIERFDTEGFPVRFGGEIRGFDVEAYLPRKDARKMDPFIHYGVAAAMDAKADAGLEITAENAERVGEQKRPGHRFGLGRLRSERPINVEDRRHHSRGESDD